MLKQNPLENGSGHAKATSRVHGLTLGLWGAGRLCARSFTLQRRQGDPSASRDRSQCSVAVGDWQLTAIGASSKYQVGRTIKEGRHWTSNAIAVVLHVLCIRHLLFMASNYSHSRHDYESLTEPTAGLMCLCLRKTMNFDCTCPMNAPNYL
ncbi:uncharacterized protein LOC121982606 [Zingiber officinale]|uniref:uncharacterized protein LOC121982606 n=1 Tax=Zingiber officinale TaxID=94328 RepID=UPI001C4D9627|nr:uncharacterized protein LOC121982606 [Zingiber officinale]